MVPSDAPSLPSLWPSANRTGADVLRIAHRGGSSGSAPYGAENLHRIAGLGAHLLEFDVRTTRDDSLVVVHDPEVVHEPTGARRRIEECTLDELRSGALTRHDDLDLAGVVRRAAAAGLGLYADIKSLNLPTAKALVEVIGTEGLAERTILASAEPTVTALCAEVAPDLPRSILFRSPAVDALALARSASAHFVHPCWEQLSRPDAVLAEASWLLALRAAGIGIVSWHVEDRGIAEGLYALGIDGVCTDEPGLLTSIATGA